MNMFYHNISAVSAHRPWMLGVGNHEGVCEYSEFERRAASNPYKASGSTSPQYFSRVHGQFYLISLSGEQKKLSEWDSEEFQWLKKELQAAHDMKKNGNISFIP